MSAFFIYTKGACEEEKQAPYKWSKKKFAIYNTFNNHARCDIILNLMERKTGIEYNKYAGRDFTPSLTLSGDNCPSAHSRRVFLCCCHIHLPLRNLFIFCSVFHNDVPLAQQLYHLHNHKFVLFHHSIYPFLIIHKYRLCFL